MALQLQGSMIRLVFTGNDLAARHPMKTYAINNGVGCAYGGEALTWDNVTYDHVIPDKNNGASAFYNYVLACQNCNIKRGHKKLLEFFKQSILGRYKPLESITGNFLNYLNAMKNFKVGKRFYVESVLPALTEQLNVSESILEQAVEKNSVETLFTALPVKWY